MRGADVVVCVTSSREPVLSRAWLAPGVHVNAVGASTPAARELDTATVADAALFADSRESVEHEAGEFQRRRAREGGQRDSPRAGRAGGGTWPGWRPGRIDAERADGVSLARSGRGGPRRRAPCRGRRPAPRPRGAGDAVIALAEIEAARSRIADLAVRTPLVRAGPRGRAGPSSTASSRRCSRSGRSRSAGRATRSARRRRSELAGGLVTASAGNMAQGVAWVARELGLPATIAVPEHAPQAKLDAIERLGGRVLRVPYDDWWQAIVTSSVPGVEGLFVHPVADEAVMAGNGTIGLEILEDLPDVDAVVIPLGGGGLTVGIASAIQASAPAVRIYTAEPATGRRCTRPWPPASRSTSTIEASFVDGSGSRRVLDPMWPRLREVVDGALSVPHRFCARPRCACWRRGHGSWPRARARSPWPPRCRAQAGGGKIVCIVSGGNINLATLSEILRG